MTIDPLARTFFARFFENDITGGSADLKSSFFWLVAFLAAPGIAMPILMSFNWDGFALQGLEFLRVASRADKVLYLGFAIIGSGVLAAITWSSLLLDRRDCLVLGTLPLPGPRIVRAKLTALTAYVVLIAVGAHALPAVSYGFFLGTHNTVAFAGRGIVAHLVASCCASAFVMLSVAAAQGLALAILGPRRFMSISPVLQSLIVAGVLMTLVLLPTICGSTIDTLGGLPPHLGRAYVVVSPEIHPWILRTPPLWFLGLYEIVLGTRDPALIRLGMNAIGGLVAVSLLTLCTYPFAYRRLVAAVAEMPAPAGRHGWAGYVVEWIVSAVSRNTVMRASSQFFLTTIRRNTRHRLTVAVAFGVTGALVSPAIFRWAPRLSQLPEAPTLELLALPLEVMLLLLVGLRIAAAMPAGLGSSWMLDSVGVPSPPARSGLWRTLFVAVVLPVTLVVGLAFRHVWGDRWALMHTTMCLSVGAVLIEMLLWGFDGMPCTKPWRPEHANVRKWWPLYLALFALIASGLPRIEQMCFEERTGFSVLIGLLAATGIILRVSHRRRRIIPEEDLDEPTQVQVLNLD